MIVDTSCSMASTPRTLYVGGSGPGNYTRIQDAIDNASDGDTIYVYPGLYVEHLRIGKSINLIGENRDATVIDGDHKGDVLKISHVNHVNISGFTIRNSGDLSSGIKMDSTGYTMISNCKIINNYGGIEGYHSNNITITDNIINNNGWCGIFMYYGEIVIVDNIIITGNGWCDNAQYSGVAFHNTGNVIVKDSVINGNGRGLECIFSHGNNIITGNTISNNIYFGLSLFLSNNTEVSSNIISGNGNDGLSIVY